MWFWQEWIPIIFMKNVAPENHLYVLATRIGLLSMFGILAILVKIAWSRKTLSEANMTQSGWIF